MNKKILILLALLVLVPGPDGAPAVAGDADVTTRNDRMKKLMERIFTGPSSSKIGYPPHPNAFLVESVKAMAPGTALDVGMGQGRNAIHLARLGWQVTGFDLSPAAIRLARAEAEKAGVAITAVEQSAEEFSFGSEKWDLIVLSYVEFRHFMDPIWQGLKPGGHVVVEYYHRDTRRYRPLNDDKSVATNELLHLFGSYRILRYEDVAARPDWMPTGDEKHRIVRLVAQKENKGERKVCYREGKTFSQGEEACMGKSMWRCEKTGWIINGACK